MRLRFLVGLVIFFLCGNATAQSPILDSLKLLLNKSQGTQRADVLNEYGYFILSFDYTEAKKVIEEAYRLSEKLNYKKGLIESLLYKGTIEDRIGNDSLSSIFYSRALSLSKQINDRPLSGRILTSIGLVRQHKDQLDSADHYYRQSYALLKDSINPLYLSFLYIRFAELSELKNERAAQLSYLKRSWKIRKKMRDPYPLVWVGANLANYYITRGEYDSALLYLNESQEVLGKDSVSEEANVIYRNKAVISANKGQHKIALDYFAKAKRFYEQNPFQWNLVDLLMEIGVTQTEVSNYETSLKYLFQALKFAEANHFEQKVAQLHFRIARAYYFIGQKAVAEQYVQKSLAYTLPHHLELDEALAENLLGLISMQKQKNEEALTHFNKSLQLRQKNDNLIGVAGSLGNLAELYSSTGEFKKGEEYALKSLALNEQVDYAVGKCYSYQALANIYLKSKQYDKALRYLDLCEALAKKIHFGNALVRMYKAKSDLWRERADYPKALFYADRYTSIKDSLFNVNVSNRILTLQYGFELDKKDNEIKLLNQQRELQQDKLEFQQAEINRQRLALVVGLIILLIGAVATYVIYGLYKKVKLMNREISEQNEEISAQAEELKEANDVLGEMNADISAKKKVIEDQAEELMASNQTIARINEGLEDKIKQRTSELKGAYHELDTFFYRSSHDFRRPLTTFMGLAEVAKVMVKEKTALELFEKVNETARNLDKMLAKLQAVSLAGNEELIRNEILFKEIFEGVISDFRDELLRKKIQVTTTVDLSKPFYSYPILVKAIVQNLMENAILFCALDHPRIELSVSEKGNEIQLSVLDNGQGIEPMFLSRIFEMYFRGSERSTGNGLGLYIVKKMTDRINARINVKSEPEKGTEVHVIFSRNVK